MVVSVSDIKQEFRAIAELAAFIYHARKGISAAGAAMILRIPVLRRTIGIRF